MKGDFSRVTFDSSKHFTRVLMQQGRVQLDADWNEQAAILLHYLQTLAQDLIGDHGGGENAFQIVTDAALTQDFKILPGHYYVNGLLCENTKELAYTGQDDYLVPDALTLEDATHYLVYLDVWERHITSIEEDNIREVALGGPDTATRAQVVWQVKTTDRMPDPNDYISSIQDAVNAAQNKNEWEEWKKTWQSPNRGKLKARGKQDSGQSTDPCITPPEARYRGAENQLYRAEVHRSGVAWDRSESGKDYAATFKWSRENGSVVFPIRRLQGEIVTLEHLGRDNRFSLEVGDWVEIVDDDYILQGRAERLFQVDAIDRIDWTVTLVVPDGAVLPVYNEESAQHPLLRRWDHQAGKPEEGGRELSDGAALITEGKEDEGWLVLEDGVQIQFEESEMGEPHQYRSGDYWLIPARTASGDVEWRKKKNNEDTLVPEALSPHGVEHYYAPLAIISVDVSGKISTLPSDLRREIELVGKSV